jgi:hypothetical protein
MDCIENEASNDSLLLRERVCRATALQRYRDTQTGPQTLLLCDTGRIMTRLTTFFVPYILCSGNVNTETLPSNDVGNAYIDTYRLMGGIYKVSH